MPVWSLTGRPLALGRRARAGASWHSGAGFQLDRAGHLYRLDPVALEVTRFVNPTRPPRIAAQSWGAGRTPSPAAACADTLETMGRLYTRAELLEQRARWRAEGQSVVFTNGCFDLLHPGHIRLLEQARSLGDVLILGLNSDAGVQRQKGPSRPILSQAERAGLACELEAVDAVVLFDEETPRDLIASLLPDCLVKGADWSHFIAGSAEVEASGGLVVALEMQPGYSTTNLVDRLISQP